MRTLLHCLFLVWLLIAAVCVPAAGAQDWADPEVVAAAVADALEGKQTELEPLEMHEAEFAEPTPPVMHVNAAPMAAFIKMFAYLLMVAVVVLLITLALQKLGVLDRGSRAANAEEVADLAADDFEAARIPDAATTAAARGEFGEALRLLLGEVLPRFYRGQGRGWPESWTSRQCLRRVPRAESARGGLADLVAAVERHHFGGRPAGRTDWDEWQRRVGELSPVAPAEVTP